jgi:hypothetical protein
MSEADLMTGTQVSGVRRSARVVKMFCGGNDEPGWPLLRELRKFWIIAEASDGAAADALGKKDESVKFSLGDEAEKDS